MMRRRCAVWGVDGSFKYKWVAGLVRWWRHDAQTEQQKLIREEVKILADIYKKKQEINK